MHRTSSAPVPFLLLVVILAALNAPALHAESKIENILLVSETTDSVVLEIHYSYDGRQGRRVFASARMTKDDDVVRYFGYRPGEVSRGKGRTRVELSTNKGAPDLFTSDGIRVQLYQGGGGAFATRNVAFTKTWTKPRTALPPKLQIVGLLDGARPTDKLQVKPVAGDEAADEAESSNIDRRILPDGTIEFRYPDGKIVQLTDGTRTVIMPNGEQQTMMFSHAQPPTPPGAPPDTTHAEWADSEAERLLDIMRTLVGNDQASIEAYLESESASSLYGRISERTRTVNMLVQP